MGCPSSIAAVKRAPRARLTDPAGAPVVRSPPSQPPTSPIRKSNAEHDESSERSTPPRTQPHSTGGSSASNESSQLARSDAALSIQSRSTNSRLSDELNPLSIAACGEEEPRTNRDPSPSVGRPQVQGVPLNSLSVFSPAPLCDRAEYARRFGGGFHDSRGLYFPTPEERYATLQEELAAVHAGADPLSAITGRGTLWVHQFLAEGLPLPLEGFRAELYNTDDEPRLLRFHTVVQQNTKLCLHRLLRRASATELNVCVQRADELVKQSTRTPCTEQLKVVLQQQAVKLHDLRVAVVSPDVILSALRHDDPNRLRSIFVSLRHDSDNHHKKKSRPQQIGATAPSSLESPRQLGLRGRSPSLTPSPAGLPQARAAPTVSPPASFSEFVFASLRDEAEYSLLTTLMIASRPSSRTRDV